jgi:hypothetical protein
MSTVNIKQKSHLGSQHRFMLDGFHDFSFSYSSFFYSLLVCYSGVYQASQFVAAMLLCPELRQQGW